MSNAIAFKNLLSGPNAFYKDINYESRTKKEIQETKAIKTLCYSYNTEHILWRITKLVLSIICFPVIFFQFLHILAAKFALIPASSPSLFFQNSTFLKKDLRNIPLDKNWKIKRFSIKVDGTTIDAAIMGKEQNLANGKWVLYSGGNGEFYEQRLKNRNFKVFLEDLNCNTLVFNYPGVGCSTGFPHKKTIIKAYQAMLRFLEDDSMGIGAKQIIGYGFSIGAAIQAKALNKHNFKKNIDYVFVKSKTFSSLSKIAGTLIPIIGWLAIKILGWNLNTFDSSINLKYPEIITQTAGVDEPQDIENSPNLICDDGIITNNTSLAKALLKNKTFFNEKFFIGVKEKHNQDIKDNTLLVSKINHCLTYNQPITITNGSSSFSL